MNADIHQPGFMEPPAGEIPFLLVADRDRLFKQRAERLEALSANHPMAGFLSFAAKLATAQDRALAAFPVVPLPNAHQLAVSRQHGMHPLSSTGLTRDPAWRQSLRTMVTDLRNSAPATSKDAIDRLLQADDAALEESATNLLSGRYSSLDLAAAPFIGAALQVYWVHMASRIGAEGVGRNEINYLCPVCGSPPVASVVKTGVAQGLRYLHCSLCSSEWHMVRVKCSNCESTKGIAYQSIADAPSGVMAETCEECGSYLKILFLEKNPLLEPVADDLATLALDILLAETGSKRNGPNLLLLPAEENEI